MAARRLSGTRGRTPTTRRRKTGRVWTALRWQGICELLQLLVGAAMYPTCRCGFHVPLAITPFARFRSRSKARTYSARPQWVFLIRRFQLALCISSCAPLSNSSAIACPVYPMRCPVLCSARRRSYNAQTMRAVLLASATAATLVVRGPSIAPAMAAWSRYRSA